MDGTDRSGAEAFACLLYTSGKVSKKQRILKLTPVMLEKVREVMEDNQ